MTVRTRLTWVQRRTGAQHLVPVLLFLALACGFAFALANLQHNLRARNIASGFGYLAQPAGFEIGETWIAYSPEMSAGRALLVGLVNTLIAGGVIAVVITLIGVLTGVVFSFGGSSGRAALRRYVALTRNIPVLLHLVVWYALFRQTLPSPRQAFVLGDVVLSNRGLVLPVPIDIGELRQFATGLAVAFGAAGLLRLVFRRWSRLWAVASGCAGLLTWVCLLPTDPPVLRGFNYVGGRVLSIEFCALVLALGTYMGGYVTEIVRGAVDTFPRGEIEGAFALGLSRSQFFLLVMTPQVLRTIAPAMVNQYINVIKLTSLGIVIGYPDLVSVSNATLNQTGQAVEAVALILITYLALSLLLSLASQLLFGDRGGATSR